MLVTLDYEPCLNYSLLHSGCRHLIRSATVPQGQTARVFVPGFTNADLHLGEGETRNLSPVFDAKRLAELGEPVRAQLVVRSSPGWQGIHPLAILPLRAWDQRRQYAEATAAFVLENDPFVTRILRKAEAGPPADGSPRPALQVWRRLYEAVARGFEVCYLYERGVLTEHHSEQLVRFPTQMQCDLGGTCLDLALLFAAAAYAAGCQPVILLLGQEFGARHALAAVWTGPARPRPVVLPAETLRERVARAELLPLECTWLAEDRPFEDAFQEGRRRAQAGPILWGVDIAAARTQVPRIPALPEPAYNVVLGVSPGTVTGAYTTTRSLEASALLSKRSLEVVSSRHPADDGRSWRLRGFAVRIGRAVHNQVRLADLSVSREHAVLFAKDRQVFVRDLGSTFGTAVDDVPVDPYAPRAWLKGQTLRIGAVELRLIED